MWFDKLLTRLQLSVIDHAVPHETRIFENYFCIELKTYAVSDNRRGTLRYYNTSTPLNQPLTENDVDLNTNRYNGIIMTVG